jgi:hypothetical protein
MPTKPIDWLNDYLTPDRKSLRDSGQPLYRYRMDDDEYKSLQKILKNSALLGIDNASKISGWNAVFVIYAAEWWRQEYDGSSWEWNKIFQSFGAKSQELTPTERSLLIETGLRYWKRSVRKINRRWSYLSTIACEGGLPLNQLVNLNSGLGKVFKQAIPKYIRLKRSGIIAIDIVIEYKSYLPQTYQNPEIYSILGDMIEKITELKDKYELSQRDNPVNWLDSNEKTKKWREDFPLPMNNDISLMLLSEMVKTAAKTEETTNKPFYCIRTLTADLKLKTQFEFSSFIPLEDFFHPTLLKNYQHL